MGFNNPYEIQPVVSILPDQDKLKFRVLPKQVKFKDQGGSKQGESKGSVPWYRNMQQQGEFRKGEESGRSFVKDEDRECR